MVFEKYTVGESANPAKHRELVGFAAAANSNRPDCAHIHRDAAKRHSATDAELEETYALSSSASRYSSTLRGMQCDRVAQIGDHLQQHPEPDD